MGSVEQLSLWYLNETHFMWYFSIVEVKIWRYNIITSKVLVSLWPNLRSSRNQKRSLETNFQRSKQDIWKNKPCQNGSRASAIKWYRPWHNCIHFWRELNIQLEPNSKIVVFRSFRNQISLFSRKQIRKHFLINFPIFFRSVRSPQCSPDVESIFRKHRQKTVE